MAGVESAGGRHLARQLGLLLLLQVDAEGVRVLGVLQERPCRREEALALLAGEVGGLVTRWGDKEGVNVSTTESF